MKRIHSSQLAFCFIILSAAICSCSTAKIASTDLNHIKTLSPDSGKALVYVVRPSIVGSAITFGVKCNDMPIGSTNGKRFIYTFLEPGTHIFTSKAENVSDLFLKVESGRTYFINQKPKWGTLFSRVQLEKLDEKTGRSYLSKCKLSGDCLAYKS